MTPDSLLVEVETALCCPEGCKAVAAGLISECSKHLTADHAKAAIAICGKRDMGRVRALAAVRDAAVQHADNIRRDSLEAGVGREWESEFRALAKIASDAL